MRKITYGGIAALVLALQMVSTSASATVRQSGRVLTFRIPPASTTPELIAFNKSDSGISPTTFAPEVEPAPFKRVNPFVTAVPEPSSWAMTIVGFALTGAFIRRRKNVRLHEA